MSHPISHIPHAAPRNLWVGRTKFWISIHYLGRGLSDDDQTHDDGLLNTFVDEEFIFRKPLHKGPCVGRCLLDVVEIVGEPIFVHTGWASESICDLIFGGRSPGVKRSTSTPSRTLSSSCKSPRSNKVAPGKASTRISRSLPS